jgi:cytochrome b
MTTYQRVLIWDIPVRLLHLVLSGSISVALVVALGLGEDHPLFVYHAWFGMLAVGALAVRVVLGFTGSRYARFSSWSLSPRVMFASIKSMLRGERGVREGGHNPAASWVMLGMLILIAAVAGTGLAGGEDIHEIAAYTLLAFIGLHLTGLLIHTIWHHEPIALSMVDGKKVAPGGLALPHASPVMGALVALVLAGWGVALARGFDAASGTLRLPFLAQPISLMEGDEKGRGERGHGAEHDDD